MRMRLAGNIKPSTSNEGILTWKLDMPCWIPARNTSYSDVVTMSDIEIKRLRRQCLRNLNRLSELDIFREAVIDKHFDNWRLLQAAEGGLLRAACGSACW